MDNSPNEHGREEAAREGIVYGDLECYRCLARAIILQAVEDTASKDAREREDAVLFLAGERLLPGEAYARDVCLSILALPNIDMTTWLMRIPEEQRKVARSMVRQLRVDTPAVSLDNHEVEIVLKEYRVGKGRVRALAKRLGMSVETFYKFLEERRIPRINRQGRKAIR